MRIYNVYTNQKYRRINKWFKFFFRRSLLSYCGEILITLPRYPYGFVQLDINTIGKIVTTDIIYNYTTIVAINN